MSEYERFLAHYEDHEECDQAHARGFREAIEAAAKVAEEEAKRHERLIESVKYDRPECDDNRMFWRGAVFAGKRIAQAIRALTPDHIGDANDSKE